MLIKGVNLPPYLRGLLPASTSLEGLLEKPAGGSSHQRCDQMKSDDGRKTPATIWLFKDPSRVLTALSFKIMKMKTNSDGGTGSQEAGWLDLTPSRHPEKDPPFPRVEAGGGQGPRLRDYRGPAPGRAAMEEL